jgi:hypothetical protein
MLSGADGGVEKLEAAMLGGFHRGDVARKPLQRAPQVFIIAAMEPPFLAQILVAVCITLWLNAINEPLVQAWVTLPHLVRGKTVAVDHQHTTRPVSKVTAVAVRLDRRIHQFRSCHALPTGDEEFYESGVRIQAAAAKCMST